jgi:hypothetical protein
MYRVHWVCSVTGSTGRGEPMSFDDATSWARAMNAKYPEIHHKIILA